MLPELAPSFAVRPRLDGLEHVVVHRRTDRCLRANSAGSVGCWTRSACGARASNCRRKWRRSRAYGIVTSYTAWFFVEDEQRRGMHTEHQTVRETSANPAVLDFSRDNHVEMKRAQTGLDAALSSRYGGGAKNAPRVGPASATPEAVANDERFIHRYGTSPRSAVPNKASAPASPDPTQITPSQFARQSQTVAGKTFFQSGAAWIDAELQKHPKARRVRVVFGSKEYFDLLANDPRLAKWAAVGEQVQFFHGGTVYELSPASPTVRTP